MIDDYNTGRRITSWDTIDPTKSLESSHLMRNVPSLSMASHNSLVPYSKYTGQVHPQYSIDRQQTQQVQYQTKSLRSSKPNSTDIETGSKLGIKSISINHILGFILGLIITAVPLGVIVTFYALLLTSNSATSTSSTTISTVTSLPSQCTSYNTINDATRLVTYTSCCYCDSSYSGWYRISGSSGTQLVTSPVTIGSCGSNYPSWWNGTHPSTVGATTSGTQCVNYSGYLCYSSYSLTSILATNCSGYYVYYLQPLTCICCSIYPRYCTV